MIDKLDKRSLAKLLHLARMGLRQEEGFIYRAQTSSFKGKRAQAALAFADKANHALEVSIGLAQTDGDFARLKEALVQWRNAHGKLEAIGWGGIERAAEMSRYEPHYVWIGEAYRKRFYNPTTGQHDLTVDAGWQSRGLPQLKRRMAR